MDIYLIDGTYELFRYFYAVPSSKDASGQQIGAVRGVLGSILTMIEGGATHIGVATDHVIESFRTDLIRAIRLAKASMRSCYRNFRFSKRHCNRWECWYGQWSNSRPTMHLLRRQRKQRRI